MTGRVFRCTVTAGAGMAGIGVLASMSGHVLPGAALTVAGIAAAGLPVYWRLRPRGTRAVIARHDRHTGRHAGTASGWNIFTTSSRWAMRRKAAVLRPSLRAVRRGGDAGGRPCSAST